MVEREPGTGGVWGRGRRGRCRIHSSHRSAPHHLPGGHSDPAAPMETPFGTRRRQSLVPQAGVVAALVPAPWEQPAEEQHVPNSGLAAHRAVHTCVFLGHQREMNARTDQPRPDTPHTPTLASARVGPGPETQRVSRNWSCSGGFLTQVPRPAFWNALNSCCLTDW